MTLRKAFKTNPFQSPAPVAVVLSANDISSRGPYVPTSSCSCRGFRVLLFDYPRVDLNPRVVHPPKRRISRLKSIFG